VSDLAGARVWAVVVTFDRPEVLDRSLEALSRQTRVPQGILVVDNGSASDTSDLLARLQRRWGQRTKPRLEVLQLEGNLGPAGGFAEGIQEALRREASAIWALDDDAVAAPGCLEHLLAAQSSTGAELVFPAIFDDTGNPADFPGWSGVLIAATAIRRAGLPRRELFWWIEDTEYLQWRLPRLHGARIERCPEAHVVHGGGPRRSPRPAWMLYYEVRNTLWYRLHVQTGVSWRRRAGRSARVLAGTLLRALLWEDRKLLKLQLIARGALDGLRGRLGRTVLPSERSEDR